MNIYICLCSLPKAKRPSKIDFSVWIPEELRLSKKSRESVKKRNKAQLQRTVVDFVKQAKNKRNGRHCRWDLNVWCFHQTDACSICLAFTLSSLKKNAGVIWFFIDVVIGAHSVYHAPAHRPYRAFLWAPFNTSHPTAAITPSGYITLIIGTYLILIRKKVSVWNWGGAIEDVQPWDLRPALCKIWHDLSEKMNASMFQVKTFITFTRTFTLSDSSFYTT